MLDEYRFKKFKETQELNFVYTHPAGARFRVNLHVQQGYVEGIFRVIPSQIDSPSRLGLPSSVETLILEAMRGLFMVAGRTGSGKTTTLASMVEMLNTKAKDKIIICIEDPIEYIHTDNTCYIKQREVGRDTHSFISAAKNALRQNPDVLLIGEILDAESMEVAITAAEAGTLVLTSIHAPDSSQALDRVVSFFPADLQKHMLTRLSLVLKGIITQLLVPRADAKGLVMASEVMVMTNALRRVVREGDFKQIPSLIETGKEAGMQRITDSLMQYYENGIIDGGYLKGYL
jgi:twitching motility protein PilT